MILNVKYPLRVHGHFRGKTRQQWTRHDTSTITTSVVGERCFTLDRNIAVAYLNTTCTWVESGFRVSGVLPGCLDSEHNGKAHTISLLHSTNVHFCTRDGGG